MLARVSNLEQFRKWREDEDQAPQDLIDRLTSFQPTEPMLAGTAFHKALETVPDGDHDTLYANGYAFHLSDGSLSLPRIRELRLFGSFGPLLVTGQVDCVEGKRVDDHKSTARFDPERYLAGFEWRFYLCLTDADVFRWNVFEIREVKPLVYEVAEPQIMEQYRYPGMLEECVRLATDFHAFMTLFNPEYSAFPEAA